MTTIEKRLKELRELREKATDKSNFSMQSGFKNSDPCSSEVDFLISHVCINVSADKEFYEAAANNWLTLITCLEKAVEALEKIHDKRKRDHQEPDAQTEVYCMNNIAETCLTEIEEILNGRGV